jgi:DNA (cytosine-5)-methyltransferase 1
MSLGFEQAGFDVVLGVDVDGHHVATHARNFPQSAVLCKSVIDLDAESVDEAIGGKKEIDLVFGGPPCQGFSNMGLRDLEDPRNSLVAHFVRLVSELQPKAFVMENVPGMLAGKTKPVLDKTIGSLKKAGYRITQPVQLLDASRFGVPQKRKRLFLLGLRQDLPGTIPYPIVPSDGQPKRPNVWEAIGDLPSVDDYEELFERDDVAYDKLPTNDYAKVARGLAVDPSDYSHFRRLLNDRCSGCLRVRHSDRAIAVYAVTLPGEVVPGHKLPRLDPNGIAPTLRAGSDSTHGSYTAPRPIHPFQPRCITAREAARLHGFPDWFGFYPLKWHAYRQIGNSVCPPVARSVGRAVLCALGEAPTKSEIKIVLGDNFVLPDDRPRTLKRIPQMLHYPPVVAYLFARAFDEKRGILKKPEFTFNDVREAIQATGVNLSWTRDDTFVAEIARSRNVVPILESCLARGYSLRPMREGDYIGEFAPLGERGTIDLKDTIGVRSSEIASAVAIVAKTTIDPSRADCLPLLLKEASVLAEIWNGKKASLALDQMSISAGNTFQIGYRIRNGRGSAKKGCAFVASIGNMPTRERIGRLAKNAAVDEVVVFVPVTNTHVLISRFEDCAETPREVNRRVFEIASVAAREVPE